MLKNTKAGVTKLLSSVTQLREAAMHTQQSGADNFNLFRILGIEANEVSTHSAFLAHLLTPGETHAQGDLFLREFLSGVVGDNEMCAEGWVVAKELSIAKGRLDIVLRSTRAKTILVIENKIDTEDQADQLDLYRKWLDEPRRRKTFKNRLLFYLTPTGTAAKKTSHSNYFQISYEKHIDEWLSRCRCKIEAPGVKSAIGSYLLTIRHMNERTFIRDDIDDAVLDLVKKSPENLPAVLRIMRIAKFIKEDLLRDFWDAGFSYLKGRIVEEQLTYWSVEQPDRNDYTGQCRLIIRAKSSYEEKMHPRFVFSQYATDSRFRWEWGVTYDAWNKDKRVRELTEALKLGEIMDQTLSMHKKHGWDGHLLYTDDLKGVERTLEEELLKQTPVSEYFEEGWKTFRQLEPQLKKLHKAIQRHIK